MKKFLGLLLLCLTAIGSVSAEISEKVLKQGWYVLPWETMKESSSTGVVTLDDVKKIATVDNLVHIKQNLPERIKEISVTTAFQKVFSRYDKKVKQLSVIQEEEIYNDIDFSTALDAQVKYLKFYWRKKKAQNLVAQDIYFIFLKSNNTDEIEIHITTRACLNVKINKKCCCCCGMSCLVASAGVCAALCYACVQFLM